MSINSKYWDEYYKEFNKLNLPDKYFLSEISKLKAGSALDIGSGLGAESCELSKRGWVVTSVDFSGYALKLLKGTIKKNNYNIKIVKKDFILFIPDKLYNLVYLGFIHVKPKDQKIILSNAISCLDKNGIFLYNGYTYDGIENDEDSEFKSLFPSLTEVLYNILQTDLKIIYAEQKLKKSYFEHDEPGSYYMSVVIKGTI
ncbi:MAG: class I SAM-dependent methyltransferase [Clostridiales bacterium]